MDSKKIEKNFSEHLEVVTEFSSLVEPTGKVAEKIIESFKNGGKVLICGNGGSAADSNHLAAEFINRYKKDRAPLPAISLVDNSSNLTSIGNDYSFDLVFSKQVEALATENDILICISTSGNSKNILEALKKAKEKKVFTILFTGKSGGEAASKCDLVLKVPSDNTPRIQEIHLILYHSICELVEEEFSE